MEGIFTILQYVKAWGYLLITKEPLTAFVIALLIVGWYVLTRSVLRKKKGKTLPEFFLNPQSYNPAGNMIFGTVEIALVVLLSSVVASTIGLDLPRMRDYKEAINSSTNPGQSAPIQHADKSQARKFKKEAVKLYIQGRYDSCIEKASAAIKSDPQYSPSYRTRGVCFQRNKQYATALNDLKKAYDLNPGSAVTLRCLAWFYATVADSSYTDGREALKFAQQAVEHRKMKKRKITPIYLRTLAAAFAQVGNFPKAVEYQQEAMMNLKDLTVGLTPADWRAVEKKSGWTRERYDENLVAHEAALKQYKNGHAHTE